MKKAINIFVSIIFLISFMGVNIHKHYSQGKLYSSVIFQEAESCCADMDHCEMGALSKSHHQKGDCSCEDKTETFKVFDNFINEKFLFSTEKTIDLYFASLFQTKETTTFFTTYSNANLFLSPPLNKRDFQSEFCVFLI